MILSKSLFYAYKYFSHDKEKTINIPEIKYNLHHQEKDITILLGMDSKYLFKNFNRNNIQLTNTWYFDYIYDNVISLSEYILKYKPHIINIVGTSKSCNGAVILSHKLSVIFPTIKFRLFLFSPYTIFDKSYYNTLGLTEKLPPTLVEIMNNPKYQDRIKIYEDSRKLLDRKNVYPFIVFPKYSIGGESVMASRLYGLKNVTFIPLPLTTHSLIHPFWKRIEENMEIEIFESTKKKLPLRDFKWFTKIQNDISYTYDIYHLIFDTDQFVERILKVT